MGQIKLAFLSRFHKKPVDFYDLLTEHAAKTLEGMQELEAWIETGEEEHREKVPQIERQADALKLDLQIKLGQTFITPFDREDIFELSIKIDEVINGAKSIVREMEAMDVHPKNELLGQFSIILLEGTRCLHNAFASLKSNPKEAANQAFLARKSENRFNKVYRQATHELFAADDVKSILKTYEVYRNMLQTAERVDRLGEKLIHVIVKNG